MVRSSVVSAVSSACEIRLVLDRRCFWSTNSKRSSRRKAPGSLATPCVDQLVLSTQKAEPQDAWAAPAAARSARLPVHAIANFLVNFCSRDLQSRAGRSETDRAQQAYGHSRTFGAAKIRRRRAGRAEARRGRARREAAARRTTHGPARGRAAKEQGRGPPPEFRGRARGVRGRGWNGGGGRPCPGRLP